MIRRHVTQAIAAGAASALGLLSARSSAQAQSAAVPTSTRPTVAALIHPGMILLDLSGPQTIFAIGGWDVRLIGKTMDPVKTDVGVVLQPTETMANYKSDTEILFVPGGLDGSVLAMQDAETLAFLRRVGGSARVVSGVCTGTLVLAAAGLLNGYRATSHWYVRDLLPLMGATTVPERVVVDRNRMTGAGVTSGLDLGLTVVAALRGDAAAKSIQLLIEYDPHPPFTAGSPSGAGPELTNAILDRRAPSITAARIAATQAGASMKG